MGWTIGPSLIVDTTSDHICERLKKYTDGLPEHHAPRQYPASEKVLTIADNNGFMYFSGAHKHDLDEYKDKPAESYPGLRKMESETGQAFGVRLLDYGYKLSHPGEKGNAVLAGQFLKAGFALDLVAPTPAQFPHAGIVSHDDFVLLRENGDVQKGYTASVKVAGSTSAQDLHVINVTKTGPDLVFIVVDLPLRGQVTVTEPVFKQRLPFADCMNSPAKNKSKPNHCST
jgi:hypothetical protein